jgi:hypothetical protein
VKRMNGRVVAFDWIKNWIYNVLVKKLSTGRGILAAQ